MNKLVFILKRFALLWLLVFNQLMFGQLDDFNFSVSTTNEICSGNGSISMTVSGTTAGATITYTLYLSSDTGSPIAQTSANVFNNLSSGSYVVVATQTLDNEQNTQSENATITDETTSLDFEITQTGACDSANLIVNVLSGNAISYEIISGPVTTAPQTSNIFNGLPEGTYVIRVYDNCDNALSKTFTIFLSNNELILEPVTIPVIFDDCETTTITNTIAAENDGLLAYPISISYTIFPPDGSAQI